MSAALAAYRLLTGAAEPFAPALLRARARRGKEDPARLPERLGREPGERPPGRLIHLHGASVGETLSLLPLVEALRAAAPDISLLVTSGTVTSAKLLAERLPIGVPHRYAPLDAPRAVARWVRWWRPQLSVFVESEIWPNWLAALRAGGAQTALVSARLSDDSLRGWGRAPGAARAVLGGFDLVAAQDDRTAAALAALGARDDARLNLKLAGGALPVDPAALAGVRAQIGPAPVLVAASTHEGEEAIVLDAFARMARPDAVLVIAPRHPERGRAVVDMGRTRRLTVALRSAGFAPHPGEVHVADTLGELGLWFALAAKGGSTLVGGSLVEGVGGHNPLEPLRAGAAVVRGPHVDNWENVHATLGDAAPVVEDAAALAQAWTADLAEPQAARGRTEAALERLRDVDADVHTLAGRLLALLTA